MYHKVYLSKILRSADTAFCFVWVSEQISTFAIYSMNGMVFITKVDSVYSTMLCLQRVELAVDLEFLGVNEPIFTHQHYDHTNSRWKSSRM